MLTGLYGLATVIIFWLMAGLQRMLMLLAGAITLPFFPLAALFNGEYWTPVRLGGGPLGLEDALCSFALGARAWFLAAMAYRAQYAAATSLAGFARRVAAVTAAALVAYTGLIALGLGVTLPSMLVPACLLAWLLVRRPDLHLLALCGGVGMTLLAYVELRLWFVIGPHLPAWWTPGTLWSRDCLGVPFGDLAWSALVGATHPAVFGFMLDVRRNAEPVRA